jgi:hypothetical protein
MGYPEAASTQVLESEDLLSSILSFNDMLAAVDGDIPHALNYLVHGARSSACPSLSAFLKKIPNISGTQFGALVQKKLGRLRELSSSILVCKFWRALNNKEASSIAIAKAQATEHAARMEALRLAAVNPEVRWFDRLCAMAATNDVAALRHHFGEKLDRSDDDEQEANTLTCPGLFAAMCDLETICDKRGVDISDSMHLNYDRDRDQDPASGGGLNNSRTCYALFANFEEVHTWGAEDAECCEVLFASLCAANAACGGGVDAVAFLREWSGSDLWRLRYDHRRFAPGLVNAVEYSCYFKYLDAPVQGITALLSGCDAAEDIHERVHGSNGTVMHLAAAVNHKKLIKAFMYEVGIFPDVACGDVFTPAQWAINRGYLELAELLKSERGWSMYSVSSFL